MISYPGLHDKYAVLVVLSGEPCEPELWDLKKRSMTAFSCPENKFFINYWDAWAYYAKALKKWKYLNGEK